MSATLSWIGLQCDLRWPGLILWPVPCRSLQIRLKEKIKCWFWETGTKIKHVWYFSWPIKTKLKLPTLLNGEMATVVPQEHHTNLESWGLIFLVGFSGNLHLVVLDLLVSYLRNSVEYMYCTLCVCNPICNEKINKKFQSQHLSIIYNLEYYLMDLIWDIIRPRNWMELLPSLWCSDVQINI